MLIPVPACFATAARASCPIVRIHIVIDDIRKMMMRFMNFMNTFIVIVMLMYFVGPRKQLPTGNKNVVLLLARLVLRGDFRRSDITVQPCAAQWFGSAGRAADVRRRLAHILGLREGLRGCTQRHRVEDQVFHDTDGDQCRGIGQTRPPA